MADLAPFLPDFDKDLETYYENTVYHIHKKPGKKDIYTIEDGGGIPCIGVGKLPNAKQLILCQASKEPNEEVVVASILNIIA